jgi:tetratricopeptide (TPR) repeat protein
MSRLLLTLVFVCCVTTATCVAPSFDAIQAKRGSEATPLMVLLGDSRRLFANQFFAMADVYFHSGYYPTIFDAKKKEGPSHLDVATHEGEEGQSSKKKEPDDDENFMGKPRDWIEKLGRNFFPTVHTHLEGQNAQELLPWLKLSAEMDPTRVETYVTAAYWLRTSLNQPDAAESFLREGLRANPNDPDILLELGRVFFYSKNNVRVARNIFELALAGWEKQEKANRNPNPETHVEILGEMVRVDRKTGDLKQLLTDLQALEEVSYSKAPLEEEIKEVKAKLAK